MTAPASAPARTSPPSDLEALLSGGRLPRSAPAVAAGVGLAAGVASAAYRGSTNLVPLALVAFLVGSAVLVGWSAGVEGRRHAVDRAATAGVVGAFALALAPLAALLVVVVQQGLERLDYEFFSRTLRSIGPNDDFGGYRHAIVATLQQVGLASLMAVPLGVLVAVYLVEFGGGRRFARTTSYVIDVMTGLPSVVAGLFVLAFWILVLGFPFSGFAGALALAILMLPVVTRSSEEMLKLVPDALREASYALGVTRWRTVLAVVVPTALPGMITGIMLAVARVFGETAPILLVTFGTANLNVNPFGGPQSSLPLAIFQDAQQPNDTALARAWTGALTLIVLVLVLNLSARWLARRFGGAKTGR